MHDALFVRGRQSLGNLPGVINRLVPGQRAVQHTLAQGLPQQQLRDNVRRAIMQTDVVDSDNVGMIQDGGSPRFLLETAQAVLILGKRGLEYFEGNIPPQPLIAGAIDFPHPPKTYLFKNPVVAKYFTNHAKLKRRVVSECYV